MDTKYNIVLSKEALKDISSFKRYILKKFKYREYADNFSIKIKQAIQKINIFPKANKKTEYRIEELDIYYKPFDTYLIFFAIDKRTISILRVLKDRMYWQCVIEQM